MSFSYGIIALVSLCMVGICVAADKKRDVWLLLVFVSVSICNLGYFMLSVSPNLGSALNSNRLAYLGSVFLPFFLFHLLIFPTYSYSISNLPSIKLVATKKYDTYPFY